MPKSKGGQNPEVAQSATIRALPYRPTCKLTGIAEPAYGYEGWRAKEFRDQSGNRFERNRDGEWERWFQITEVTGPGDKLLYQYKAPKKPVECDDIRDRNDDFEF